MFKPKASSFYRLSSHQARKRAWFIFTAFVGYFLFIPLYQFGIYLREQDVSTELFIKTLLLCVIPYTLVVRLNYKAIHLPPEEQRMLLPINTIMPFLLLVLVLALVGYSSYKIYEHKDDIEKTHLVSYSIVAVLSVVLGYFVLRSQFKLFRTKEEVISEEVINNFLKMKSEQN
jgi:CDP-diglyceride synthetase